MNDPKMTVMKYLTQRIAQELDKDLMSPAGAYTLEQLMELAGLSCASAVLDAYPPKTHPRVLVACGPGNQGGDGLVAARHLWHFGYDTMVWYPKEGKQEFYQKLLKQYRNLESASSRASVIESSSSAFVKSLNSSSVVLDAIFGFSFSGDVREPFVEPIEALKRIQTEKAIVSVDIPSAWDVEKGNLDQKSFMPSVLISLTAPKAGSKEFIDAVRNAKKGQMYGPSRHYLGGRFIPPNIVEKYSLTIPEYQGSSQIVDISDYKAVVE